MMHMKKLLFIAPALLAAVLLAAGCGASRMTPEEKKAEEARIAEEVQACLDARQYKIVVESIHPMRGTTRYSDGTYSLRVDGSKVYSHLPFFGVAYSVPYGGGKALVFDDDIDEYYMEQGRRKDRQIITFLTDNGEDIVVFTVTVFDTGSADIHVKSRNRESISFRGHLEL